MRDNQLRRAVSAVLIPLVQLAWMRDLVVDLVVDYCISPQAQTMDSGIIKLFKMTARFRVSMKGKFLAPEEWRRVQQTIMEILLQQSDQSTYGA